MSALSQDDSDSQNEKKDDMRYKIMTICFHAIGILLVILGIGRFLIFLITKKK
jgi:hypothetical protein